MHTHPTGTPAAVHLAWLAAACVVSFAVAAICAGILRMPREWFLLPWVAIAFAFVAVYARSTGADLAARFRGHAAGGIAAAALVSVFLVRNVLSQPASKRAEGLALAAQIAWGGVTYGLADGLLLSVFPVVAIEHAFPAPRSRAARLGIDGAALVASLVLAAAYHLGYPEFRDAGVLKPVIGNGAMTLAYLLARSPIAPLLAHVVMHVAAVLHGPATTAQLPPHY